MECPLNPSSCCDTGVYKTFHFCLNFYVPYFFQVCVWEGAEVAAGSVPVLMSPVLGMGASSALSIHSRTCTWLLGGWLQLPVGMLLFLECLHLKIHLQAPGEAALHH